MTDPYLSALLHSDSNLSPKVDQIDPEFEAELEKISEEYAQEEIDSGAATSPLFSKEQAKNHLKNQFKEAVHMEEQLVLLKQAINCILHEGKSYLSPEEWEQLSTEISNASKTLDKLTYQEDLPEKLYPYLGMTEIGLNAIDTIGRAKYEEENFSLAVAINAFLITLNPESVRYWLHLGISYQDSGFYEKAIKAYSICHLLNPSNIPAWIFCSECYLKSHNVEDAKIECEEAERIAELLQESEHWEPHFSYLKKSLKRAF